MEKQAFSHRVLQRYVHPPFDPHHSDYRNAHQKHGHPPEILRYCYFRKGHLLILPPHREKYGTHDLSEQEKSPGLTGLRIFFRCEKVLNKVCRDRQTHNSLPQSHPIPIALLPCKLF